jgi:hypothetical protein
MKASSFRDRSLALPVSRLPPVCLARDCQPLKKRNSRMTPEKRSFATWWKRRMALRLRALPIQLGRLACFFAFRSTTGQRATKSLPVRESLRRQGLRDDYVLLAGHPQGQKFAVIDHEPIQKLIEWAKKTYPINPRRIYMYGKGEGGKISAEFAATHPSLVTAAISYSWGWWIMPSEPKEPIDFANSAPEFYMVLGLRDLAHHITTVRDACERVKEKGQRGRGCTQAAGCQVRRRSVRSRRNVFACDIRRGNDRSPG